MKKLLLILSVIFLFASCPGEQPTLSFEYRNAALSENGIDFSEFSVDKKMIALNLTNPSGQTVVVSSIKSSSADFKIKSVGLNDIVFPFEMEPGEKFSFVLQYLPASVGELSCTVTCSFAAADGKTPAAVISFPVKAQISSLPQGMGNSGLIFTGNMTTLRFGDVIRGLTAVKEVSFSNITSETVTVTAVSANDPYYPGSSFELPVSVAPGAQIKIPIEFRSHDLLPSGLIVEPVTVTTGTGSFSFNAEGSPIVSNEPLLVLTAGGESITEGSVYRFSEVAVNTKGTPETFRVTNKGSNPLRISGLEFSSGSQDFRFAETYSLPVLLNAGASFDFKIYFHPTRIGNISSQMTVRSNSVDQPNLNFTLSGSVLQNNMPRLQVLFEDSLLSDGDLISFPQLTPEDEAVELPILLKSTGTASLCLYSVICENTEGEAFSLKDGEINQKVLESGKDLTIYGVFNVSGKQKGNYSAKIVISSNDSSAETFTFYLSGLCDDSRELLPPVVSGPSFFGEETGDPQFTLSTPLGSSGVGKFEYEVQQFVSQTWSALYRSTVEKGEETSAVLNLQSEDGSALPSGTYQLIVTEKDASDQSSNSVRLNLIVSREQPAPPVITITSPHSVYPDTGETESLKGRILSSSSKPVWTWTADSDAVVSYQCRLYSASAGADGVEWTGQASNTFSRGNVSLSSGEYVFEVRSVDAYGREGEIAQSFLLIDTVAPKVTLKKQHESAATPIVIMPVLYNSTLQIQDFDPGLEYSDNNFSNGDLKCTVSYDLISAFTEGIYKATYTVTDLLDNSVTVERQFAVLNLSTAQITITGKNNYDSVDFPILADGIGLDLKKESLLPTESGSYMSQWLGTDYPQLTFQYSIEGTEFTDLASSSSRRASLVIPYAQDASVREEKPFTVTASFRKADGTDEAVTLTQNLTVYPQIGLKNPSFETSSYSDWLVRTIPHVRSTGAFNRASYNWDLSTTYNSDKPLTEEMNIQSSSNEPYIRIIKGNPSSSNISEPTGGPAQLEGNNAYLKFCDLNYLVHTAQGTTDTVGALSALFQRVPVIEGQKYRVTVRARNYSPHTNSWYPNRVQLQVHNASMKTTLVETSGDGFCPGNFEAYVSNSANATTKNNGSSANNDWQTLELEFTAPAGGSVSLGIFINNQGVTDSWHAVLIDDFRMEYVK